MAKSYFAILGVTASASPDEIRSAYRRLAKEFHPDRYTGGSGTFSPDPGGLFVLGDMHRRSEYERSLHRASLRNVSTAASLPGAGAFDSPAAAGRYGGDIPRPFFPDVYAVAE